MGECRVGECRVCECRVCECRVCVECMSENMSLSVCQINRVLIISFVPSDASADGFPRQDQRPQRGRAGVYICMHVYM